LWGDDDGSIVGGKDCRCPTKYEFLLNFCYVCGLLGHINENCGKDERKQDRNWLLVNPSCRRVAYGTQNKGLNGSNSRGGPGGIRNLGIVIAGERRRVK
jgi:hypothetical protein